MLLLASAPGCRWLHKWASAKGPLLLPLLPNLSPPARRYGPAGQVWLGHTQNRIGMCIVHTHIHACFCKYVTRGGAPNWSISQPNPTCQQIWSSWSSMVWSERKSHTTGPTNLPNYRPHKHNPHLLYKYTYILIPKLVILI